MDCSLPVDSAPVIGRRPTCASRMEAATENARCYRLKTYKVYGEKRTAYAAKHAHVMA